MVEVPGVRPLARCSAASAGAAASELRRASFRWSDAARRRLWARLLFASVSSCSLAAHSMPSTFRMRASHKQGETADPPFLRKVCPRGSRFRLPARCCYWEGARGPQEAALMLPQVELRKLPSALHDASTSCRSAWHVRSNFGSSAILRWQLALPSPEIRLLCGRALANEYSRSRPHYL